MVKQQDLFGDSAPGGVVVSVPGPRAKLSREQKNFNRLTQRIANARTELAEWRALMDEMQRRQAGEIQPLMDKLNVARRALVALYDRTAQSRLLASPRDRETLSELICDHLQELLEQREDPQLIAIYDRHSGVSYAEEAQIDAEMEEELMQSMAREVFGVKLDAEDLKGPPEEAAGRIAEKVRNRDAAREKKRLARLRKKDPKAAAREERRIEQARAAEEAKEKTVTQSVREVYRKLASELHPDRETDPAERERKTALMQKVNQAYEADDLLALLELQLEIEQITEADLSDMAREKLQRYTLVLNEHLRLLNEQLQLFREGPQWPGAPFGGNTPRGVREQLNSELIDMQSLLEELRQQEAAHQNVKLLRAHLKQYRREMEEEFGALAGMMGMDDSFDDTFPWHAPFDDDPPFAKDLATHARGRGRKRR